MKELGYTLTAIGVVWLIIAFNMETSVATGGGVYLPGRVENIGLIAERQNHLFISGLITVIGVLLMVVDHMRDGSEGSNFLTLSRKTPVAPESRDLQHDAYRLWLAKEYNIQRNEVFEKFVVLDTTFDSLDDALAFAHAHESERVKASNEQFDYYRISEEKRAAKAEVFNVKFGKSAQAAGLLAFVALVFLVPYIAYQLG